MPMFDFSNYDANKIGEYSVVTPGTYLCRVFQITVDSTKEGAPMWKLELIIEEEGSEFYGKKLFDNLIFSSKAAARAKHILAAFGIDVENPHEYEPDELQDKYALIKVDRTEKYINRDGKEREKSVIAYSGYKSVKNNPASPEDEIPW